LLDVGVFRDMHDAARVFLPSDLQLPNSALSSLGPGCQEGLLSKSITAVSICVLFVVPFIAHYVNNTEMVGNLGIDVIVYEDLVFLLV